MCGLVVIVGFGSSPEIPVPGCCDIGYWLAVKGSNLEGVICLGDCYVGDVLAIVVECGCFGGNLWWCWGLLYGWCVLVWVFSLVCIVRNW